MIRVARLFAQVLSLVSRREFAKAVRRQQAEKAARGLSCWDRFVAMRFEPTQRQEPVEPIDTPGETGVA